MTQVSAGGSHFCAVMASGTLRCWGSNDYGQLGYGDILEDEENIGYDEPPASLCEVPVI
ncbi:MAG: RCC1 domain-containing protein [Polyangia bacterium]